MATYNLTSNRTTASVANPSMRSPGVRVPYLVEKVIDLGRFNSDAGLASGDVIQVIDVPIGTTVLDAGMQQINTFTEGGSTAYSLGIGGDVAVYVAAAVPGGTAGNYWASALTSNDGFSGRFVTSQAADAETIDVVTTVSTTTAGLLRVFAYMLDSGPVMSTEHNPDSYYDTAV